MEQKAFTLAEALLALAVTGIVAATTIPAVVTKTTKEQYVARVKKAYNTLKQVEQKSMRKNGNMKHWDWTYSTSEKTFDTYFKEHFDILKDCGIATDKGCFADEYKALNGKVTGIGAIPNMSNVRKIITSDGIAFAYSKANNVDYFWVDVNGRKGPNIVGRDLHRFSVHHHNEYGLYGIKPYYTHLTIDGGIKISSTSTLNTFCHTPKDKAGSSSEALNNGNTCTARILAEGAMNY